MEIKISKKLFSYFLIFFTFFILIEFIPFFYDSLYGEKKINSWMEDNLKSEDPIIIAQTINFWIKENIQYPGKSYLYWYKLHNGTRFWIRNTISAKLTSWTIYTGLGRCEEDAYLFVEIMSRKGFRSRVIKTKGWDHVWAEFYPYNDSYKIIVDPSANKIIYDPKNHASSSNWTKIYAIDIGGNKEDLSNEYR